MSLVIGEVVEGEIEGIRVANRVVVLGVRI